jgi:hypothetical protein
LARLYESDGHSRYYLNGSSCHHKPRPVTVREWIGDVASDESENAGRLWRDVLAVVLPCVQPDKLKASTSEREKIIRILVGVLWLSYDTQKPFVPQLEVKLEKLKEVFCRDVDVP